MKKIMLFAVGALVLTCAILAVIITQFHKKPYVNAEITTGDSSSTSCSETEDPPIVKKSPKERIDDLIEEKEIPPRICDLIYASYEMLDQNYDTVYRVFERTGVMNKEEALAYYCDSLEYVEHFVLFENGQAQVGRYIYHSMNDHLAFYDGRQNGIVLDHPNTVETDCDLFLHELTHANQNKRGISRVLERTHEGLYVILSEGEGSVFSCATSDKISFESVSFYTNFAGDERIQFGGRTMDSNYNGIYKLYVMLMYLTSYQDVQVLSSAGNWARFKDKIDSKYEIDSQNLLSRMEELGLAFMKHKEYDIESCLKQIDEAFLECLSKDLNHIETIDDLISFYNFYRFYKLQFQTVSEENQIYDFGVVEDLLYEKCAENDLMLFTNDEELNRVLFDTLLTHSYFEYFRVFSVITDCVFEYKDGTFIVSKNGEEKIYQVQ